MPLDEESSELLRRHAASLRQLHRMFNEPPEATCTPSPDTESAPTRNMDDAELEAELAELEAELRNEREE
ncbi:hypothetical protein [Candidatus Halobonum tyrrellensis]|uniref:hypothetical protein n=1 Tax=Candidatus Halobonum tyrrellensis TaxID=1431545 RepID=UPI0012691A42|nr:hypothetical protein [Candidatus Halobonum tyrrellensis]